MPLAPSSKARSHIRSVLVPSSAARVPSSFFLSTRNVRLDLLFAFVLCREVLDWTVKRLEDNSGRTGTWLGSLPASTCASAAKSGSGPWQLRSSQETVATQNAFGRLSPNCGMGLKIKHRTGPRKNRSSLENFGSISPKPELVCSRAQHPEHNYLAGGNHKHNKKCVLGS